MHVLQDPRSAPKPFWDGSRVTFQVMDRETPVDCAISRGALLDIAQRSYLPTGGWMACFLKSREQIEAIAIAKFRGRSPHAGGLLNIWSEDIDPSPPSVPDMACAAATRQSA